MRVSISSYTDMLTNGMQVLQPITVKTLVLQLRYLSGNSGIHMFLFSIIRYTAHSFPVESSANVSFPQASISKKKKIITKSTQRLYRQCVPCGRNSSYSLPPIVLKLCRCFLHGMKMCIWFWYSSLIYFISVSPILSY